MLAGKDDVSYVDGSTEILVLLDDTDSDDNTALECGRIHVVQPNGTIGRRCFSFNFFLSIAFGDDDDRDNKDDLDDKDDDDDIHASILWGAT